MPLTATSDATAHRTVGRAEPAAGGAHPPRLPVRDIVGAGEQFGIAPATMRVALTRLVRAGDLVAEQAVYSLSDRHLERHRLQELELDPGPAAVGRHVGDHRGHGR